MDQDKHILELLEDDTILFYSWALGNRKFFFFFLIYLKFHYFFLLVEGVGNIFVTVTEKSLKLWDVEFGSKKFSTDFSEKYTFFKNILFNFKKKKSVKEFFIVEGN